MLQVCGRQVTITDLFFSLSQLIPPLLRSPGKFRSRRVSTLSLRRFSLCQQVFGTRAGGLEYRLLTSLVLGRSTVLVVCVTR